ncbi:MAG: right-handed parallel beta-helix repeat-containing protein, partial [Planctomycetaceae bacterium]|nr:right-handed parallel beta-helix repeat-containing protein [Planctomycetaceae bacterium]
MQAGKYRQLFAHLAVAAIGAAALWGGETQAQVISGPPNSAPWGRFDANVIGGNQPGVQSGSAQVGGFISLFDDPEKIFFLDGSSNSNLNSGNWSADIGFGSRFLHQGSGAVLGGNVFYNYRNAETIFGNHGFQTVGFGVEALLEQWAFRSNATFNVGSTQANGLVQGLGTPSYVDQVGGPMGVQNILLSGLQSNFTSALNTVDMNVSRKLDIANAELGAGVYYLSANHGPNSWGVNGTAEAWLTDNLATNVTVSHDNLFDTTVFGGVSVYFGGPRIDADARHASSTSRLWARVQRRRVIPVANYNLPTADQLAHDPDTGDLITVLQVAEIDDLVAAPAVGTDIILVDAGATFTGLDPIVLSEGQRLLSASIAHQVDTAEIGSIQIPETDLGGITTIDMSTGNAVVIANNTEVSGFTITNASGFGDAGIFGSNAVGFDINRNDLSRNYFGVNLSGTNSGTMSSNTAYNNYSGFAISTLSGGTVNGNTAHHNTISGFAIDTLSGGTVSGNTAHHQQFGFNIINLSGGTVSDNAAYEHAALGFNIINLSGGTVSGNTAHGNIVGFYIDTLSGGALSGNTAHHNSLG